MSLYHAAPPKTRGGSGFIAAFTAGVVFRLALGRDPEELNRLTEEVGAVLNGTVQCVRGSTGEGDARGGDHLPPWPAISPRPPLEEIGYGVLGGVIAGLVIAAIFRQASRSYSSGLSCSGLRWPS